jgi:hypothetical protein
MADSTKSTLLMMVQIVASAMTVLISIMAGMILSNQSDMKSDIGVTQRDMIDVQKAVVAIESDRFSSRDGMSILKMINDLNVKIAKLPPPEHDEEHGVIEDRIRKLEYGIGANR